MTRRRGLESACFALRGLNLQYPLCPGAAGQGSDAQRRQNAGSGPPVADSQGRVRTQAPRARSRHSHCGGRRLGPIAAGHWDGGGVATPPDGTWTWSIASAASGTPKKTSEPRSPPSWSATSSAWATTPASTLPTSRARSRSSRKIPRRSCARPGMPTRSPPV